MSIDFDMRQRQNRKFIAKYQIKEIPISEE